MTDEQLNERIHDIQNNLEGGTFNKELLIEKTDAAVDDNKGGE